jgi:hypothetical protein
MALGPIADDCQADARAGTPCAVPSCEDTEGAFLVLRRKADPMGLDCGCTSGAKFYRVAQQGWPVFALGLSRAHEPRDVAPSPQRAHQCDWPPKDS